MSKSSKSLLYAYGLCIILGITFQILTSFLLEFILMPFPDVASKYSNDMDALLTVTVPMILYVSLLAPLFEEFLFRFVILRLAGKFMPFMFANVIQALLFGIYHMNLIQGIYAFILGMVIGYILKFTGRFVSCVIFHSSLNITGLIINYYLVDDYSLCIKIIITIISLVMSLYLLYVLKSKSAYLTEEAI